MNLYEDGWEDHKESSTKVGGSAKKELSVRVLGRATKCWYEGDWSPQCIEHEDGWEDLKQSSVKVGERARKSRL